MNGLSADIDLSFLIGREVVQVSIGVAQIIFHFDDCVDISVESEFKIRRQGTLSAWEVGKPNTACDALSLIGCKTDGVEGRLDGTLTMNFTGGISLIILDTNKEYESYQITKVGATIVV